MPAGVRKMPPPIVMPMTRPIELHSPSLRSSVAMWRGYYQTAGSSLRYTPSMHSRLRPVVVLWLVLVAIPAFAQTPGVDENDCKPSPLLSRMTGVRRLPVREERV
jgi:hypothetical protein